MVGFIITNTFFPFNKSGRFRWIGRRGSRSGNRGIRRRRRKGKVEILFETCFVKENFEVGKISLKSVSKPNIYKILKKMWFFSL